MVRMESSQAHLTDDQILSYLNHELGGETLHRVESHLAECPACRQELIDAREVIDSVEAGSPPRWAPWKLLVPAAAAVAALFFFSGHQDREELPGQPPHREAPGEVRVAPVPVSPVGLSAEAGPMVWTRVPGADRYRLTLFESEGAVLFRINSADTVVLIPDSVGLHGGEPYLWRVEARVGWDVWESSELVEFRLGGEGLPDPNAGG